MLSLCWYRAGNKGVNGVSRHHKHTSSTLHNPCPSPPGPQEVHMLTVPSLPNVKWRGPEMSPGGVTHLRSMYKLKSENSRGGGRGMTQSIRAPAAEPGDLSQALEPMW